MVDFDMLHTLSPTNSIAGRLECPEGRSSMYWSLVDLPSSSSFLEFEKVLGSVGPISAASEMGNCLEHLMKVKGRSRTASILGGACKVEEEWWAPAHHQALGP